MGQFTPFGIVERLVPGFANLKERLTEIAPSGFTLALNVRFFTPELVYSTYSEAWIEDYMKNNYAIMDPIHIWSSYNDGQARWSEIGLPAKLPLAGRVLEKAKEHGLNYGAIIVVRNRQSEGRKSLLSLSHDDRELSDVEIDLARGVLSEVLEKLNIASGLSNHEIDTLQLLASGMTQEDISNSLGISRDAVKKRLERAREQLQAKNSAHAVAIAIKKGVIAID